MKEADLKTKASSALVEDRAAYIPFSVAETVKANNELKASTYSSTQSYSTSSSSSTNASTSTTIDLHVTNLDQSIGAKEMKHLLTTVFKQHVMVTPTIPSAFNLIYYRCYFYSYFTMCWIRSWMWRSTCKATVIWLLSYAFRRSKMHSTASRSCIDVNLETKGSW